MMVDSKKKMLVHRLVAMAFIPNPDNLPEINHKDGTKDNNVPSNLEWCTTKHNVTHAWKIGLHAKRYGAQLPWTRLTETMVREIFHAVKVGGETQRPVAERFGVSQATVKSIVRGETWAHLKLLPAPAAPRIVGPNKTRFRKIASSDTPKTDAVVLPPDTHTLPHEVVYAQFARDLERGLFKMRNERDELQLQVEKCQHSCDHEWTYVDDSFDHAYGTEVIRFHRCEKCGKTRPDNDEPNEPDYDAPRPLTPLENHQRNDEHNVP